MVYVFGVSRNMGVGVGVELGSLVSGQGLKLRLWSVLGLRNLRLGTSGKI